MGGGSKVKQMEQELEDVTDLMRDNLSKVMERGERIDSLLDKTETLKTESVSFRANAKRYNNDLWWQDQKGRIMLGLAALAIMVMIGLWIRHEKLTSEVPG